MSTTDELVASPAAWQRRVRYVAENGFRPGPWQQCECEEATDQFKRSAYHEYRALYAADAIETLTRERDEAREACAMNNETHSRISADYTQTIRALEARITALEADKARLRDALERVLASLCVYRVRQRRISFDLAMEANKAETSAREALEATP